MEEGRGEGGVGLRRLKKIAHHTFATSQENYPPTQVRKVEKQSPAEIRFLDSGIPAMAWLSWNRSN